MTYASDMTLLDSVLLASGQSFADGSTSGASLDHAMWFHRPFRADRWLLYAQDSPSASGARGLARGEVYTEDGTLVVSVVQEGLIRRPVEVIAGAQRISSGKPQVKKELPPYPRCDKVLSCPTGA